MPEFKAKIGIWNRRRALAGGGMKHEKKWVVNFKCPETGGKRRKSFDTKAEAEDYLQALTTAVLGERYYNPNTNPTVAEAVEHWRQVKAPNVRASTMGGYDALLKIIVGPLLQGSPKERVHFALTGEKPHRDTKLLQMLGPFKVSELSTAQLRRWHALIRVEIGTYTANRVISVLKSVLALAEEDFGVRVCSMPTNLARRKSKPKKEILATEEVAKLLEYARQDKDRGIFYAFPFLTGVRVSEQLGLLWEDIDLERNVITIRRVQSRDGRLEDQTKTEAGEREIPISPMLRTMLLEWRLNCPRLDGILFRVFPGPGVVRQWSSPRIGGGGPVLYSNFLKRYWRPSLKRAGVRYVTHHSARHSFVSTLQAQGVEVGLVAKLAGHANPAITLGHYTQAVRGGAQAMTALDDAFTA